MTVVSLSLLLLAASAIGIGRNARERELPAAAAYETSAARAGTSRGEPDEAGLDGQTAEPESENEPAGAIDGEAEIRALHAAYPGIFQNVGVRDGEWAIQLNGAWYYWADGRLLPEGLRELSDQFVAIRFYNYSLGPLVVREIAPELEERLRDRTGSITSDGDDSLRFNDFLDTLYGISSRADAEGTVRAASFLGMPTRVHPLLVEPLERVERRIRASEAASPEVTQFVEDLISVHAYNWRNIAGTQRRSYHSYGVAIDLVPRSYGGRWAYWLWAAESGIDEWWDLPLDERWLIPQQVIDAFEAEGFVWGGKWLFFDHLHFEYRPESIIMAQY